MGGQLACSTQCTPACISRGHPPGFDEMEAMHQPAKRKGYPVADPLDAKLGWQVVAVRHAWRKAKASDLQGDGRIDAAKAASMAYPEGKSLDLPSLDLPKPGVVSGSSITPPTQNNGGDEPVEYIDI
mmetsp:Transcript_19695/g.45949  ORF Transcript_19695/g.45949 Transcript_19695/m.45949 type:complete len:127 (-) Transcript_19695:141-521(-)